MNKPFSVSYREFKQELTNLINNSSLPALVLESILQNCLYEINNIANNQYREDKARYENYLSKSEKDDEK